MIDTLAAFDIPMTAASLDSKVETKAMGENGEVLTGDAAMAALMAMWASLFQQQVVDQPAQQGQLLQGNSMAKAEGEPVAAEGEAPVLEQMVADGPRGVAGLLKAMQAKGFNVAAWAEAMAPALEAQQNAAPACGEGAVAALVAEVAPQVTAPPTPDAAAAAVPVTEALPAPKTASDLKLPVETPEPEREASAQGAVEAPQPVAEVPQPVAPAPVAAPVVAPESVEAAVQEAVAPVAPKAAAKVSGGAALGAAKDESRVRRGEMRKGAVESVADPAATQAPVFETVVELRKQIVERPVVTVNAPQEKEPEPTAAPVDINPAAAQLGGTPTNPLVETADAPVEQAAPAVTGVIEQSVVAAKAEPAIAPAKTNEAAANFPKPEKAEPAPAEVLPAQSATPAPASEPARVTRPQAVTQTYQSRNVNSQPFTAPAPREAKTISIRIPLTDGAASGGQATRHIDLVFQHRNQDLTLQFQAPSKEIQKNLEDSMSNLMNQLRSDNWVSKASETQPVHAGVEAALETPKRVENILTPAPAPDYQREAITTSQGQAFQFEDQGGQGQGREEQRQQSQKQRQSSGAFAEELAEQEQD